MASKWPFLMSLPLSSWLLIQFVCGTVFKQHLLARLKKKKKKILELFGEFPFRKGGGKHHNVVEKDKTSLYLLQSRKKVFQNMV